MPTTQHTRALAVAPGTILGKASILVQFRPDYSKQTIPEEWVDTELKRLQRAAEAVIEQIEMLKQRKETEEEAVSILRAQAMMLRDPELLQDIHHRVEDQNYSLEYAIFQAFQQYIDKFQQSANPNLIERIPDLIELRDKLAQTLHGQESQIEIPDSCILVAKELGIQDLIRYSNRIQGLILEKGGLTSHVAIIANALGIPSVFGVHNAREWIENGDLVAIDGHSGDVWLRPTPAIQTKLLARQQQDQKLDEELQYVAHQPSITRCGTPFNLMANAELPEESTRIQRVACTKIGLLRTETLLIQNPDNHSPNHQLNYYRQFLLSGDIEQITIRLFDAGGDKIIGTNALQEKNPNLGWRGIRFLLGQEKLLRQQLYAICKLSGMYMGKVRMLLPMVSTLDEVRRVKTQVDEIRAELKKNKVAYDPNMPIGLMIEVPSVAILANDFAEHADFFSIGTNDLTQYTMAADRANDLVSELYQQSNPAVWQLIKMTAQAAENAGIPISVCGEMAGRPCAAAAMLGLGIKNLSMVPSSIPKVKKLLMAKSLQEMKDLANTLLHAHSSNEVEEAFIQFAYDEIDL